MSAPSRPGGIALALLLLAAAVPAAPVATIAVSELRPGMTGYGLSVFAGGRIDTFRVELIDVMRNVSPRGDMILCRCTGQGLEHSGIIAGMSGSPVYFDGRLAGAVAYGWGFSKDPIGGVTPIGEMLELLDLPGAAPGTRPPGTPAPAPGVSLPRLPLPLGIAGAPPGLVELAGSLLAGSGLLPVAAGGAGGRGPAGGFLPGGAVGVVLADGDVSLAAVGTVTWVDGDRLLAFGHPMFQAGAVALPMAGGDIHAVIPNYASSFKLFSPGPVVGTIVQDRLPAVSGVVGPVPPMLPVRVSLTAPALTREYRFRVADIAPLVPSIAALGIADVVYASEGTYEEATLEARVRVTLAGAPAVAFRQVLTGRAPADGFARTLADRLRLLIENRFRPVQVESIDVTLALRPGLSRLTVTGVQPARTTVAPGDTLALWLALRDAAGNSSTRRFAVAIPPTAPAGRLTLSLSSADSFLLRELYRSPGAAEPQTLAELIGLLERTGDEDVLVIAGYTGTPGLALGARELPVTPPTLRRVLDPGRRGGRLRPVSESRLILDRYRLDGVIAGTHEITLEVTR